MLMKLTAARVKTARKHVGEIDPRSRNSSLRSQSIVIFFSQKSSQEFRRKKFSQHYGDKKLLLTSNAKKFFHL